MEKPRTQQQNRALHKYFDLLAEELNGAGFNVQLVLKEKVEIDWTPALVKEVLWRSAQRPRVRPSQSSFVRKVWSACGISEHRTWIRRHRAIEERLSD